MIAALVFTVASLHLNDSREYQQSNPGAGIEWAVSDVSRLGGGAYRNSSGRLSAYVNASVEKPVWRVSVGLAAGAVTGYKWPILPIAYVFFKAALGLWELRVNVLPSARPILGFQVARRIGG